MHNYLYKLLFSLSLTTPLFLTLHTLSLAYFSDLPFIENFSAGANNWTNTHTDGSTDTRSYWKIYNINQNDVYGVNTPYKYNGVGNSVAGNIDWTDYLYEVDLYPINIANMNLMFRYQSDAHNYEIHIVDNYKFYLQETGGLINNNGYYLETYNMKYDSIYNLKIELISNKIRIWIKEKNDTTYTALFDLTDDTPLEHGKVGLRFAFNNNRATVFYFDNIVVTDLSEPAFPYFSQIDSKWKDEKYDHIDKTIGQVGCALTSTAMVLKSYGFDKVPLAGTLTDLTPSTLNDWLNADPQKKRWGRDGAMNWMAITELARDLHKEESNKYKELELFVYPKKTSGFIDKINTLLDAKNVLIVKETSPRSPSGKHFFVTPTYQLDKTNSNVYTYALFDPFDKVRTSLTLTHDHHPPKIDSVIHYKKSETDLSYIWLDTDEELYVTIKNPQQQELSRQLSGQLTEDIVLSWTDEEKPLSDDIADTTAANPYWQSAIKEPISGKYILTLTSLTSGWFNYELYLYDKDGDSQVFRRRQYFSAGFPYTISVDYNHDQIASVIFQPYSFERLFQLLTYEYSQGGFLKKQAYSQLDKFIRNAQKVYGKDPEDGKNLVQVFTKHLQNDLKQKNLNPAAANALIQEALGLWEIL